MLLKDLFFPKLCLGCGALGSYICLICEQKLKMLKIDTCIYCKRKSYMGLTHPDCKRKNGVDGVIGFYLYNSFMKKIIKNIKYRLATDVFKELCSIIQPKLQKKLMFYKQICKNGLLQPTPLHSTKLKLRGFNQAALIAQFFNTVLQMPIIDYFERVKSTKSQAELKNIKSRYLNVRGAFKFKKNMELSRKPVIVVDDVITSGYTVMELSRTIKRQGVEKVFVVALAKG